MKSRNIFSLLTLSLLITGTSFSQVKTETFKVSGNCGMCKTKIEKAAKEAGASTASWNEDSKQLTVKYNSASTNTAKIQKKIAETGYDNAGFKTTMDAYNKLHSCCKYDREQTDVNHACCGEKCKMKDGKCTDMAGCKDKGCCTADGKCKIGAECKHDAAHADMDCCKDGKCTMQGHSGTDCCKKS